MKVEVFNAYTQHTDTFIGQPEQVREQLRAKYPFLSRYSAQSLHDELSNLSRQQAFFVAVEQ
jgi:hypothetical protein